MSGEKNSVSIAIILYTSKTLANGEHPLMLRITRNRKRSYKSIGISCKASLWDLAKNQPKRGHPDKAVIEDIIAQRISEYKSKVLELKSSKKDFTAGTLLSAVEKPVNKTTVFQFYEEVIQRLKDSKKIGNANTYKDSLRSLKGYTKNKDQIFQSIDYGFLIKYETYLRKNGLKDTSMSVYFRTLRALYNQAIKESIVRKTEYPFDTFKIAKFGTETTRRAITKTEVRNIEALTLDPDSNLCESRDYFLFSYYGAGVNFIDIALLKWENIENDRVYYKRSKTGRHLQFKLHENMLPIIEKQKYLVNIKPNMYVFPILNIEVHKTPTQIDNRIQKVIKRVNKDLKEIGTLAGIAIPLTTYVARHTFATVMKKNGTSTSVISESLGHESESVTQIYLKSFDNDVMDEAMKHL